MGSRLLIVESRMALASIISQMDSPSNVSRKYAGDDMAARPTGGPFT
jgi:hypothetical protein